jgi:hypothetical protein
MAVPNLSTNRGHRGGQYRVTSQPVLSHPLQADLCSMAKLRID